jgi:hypothetical protein
MKKYMFILLALFVFTACNKDDDDDNKVPASATFEDQLVGKYAFESATFNQDVTMYNVMAPGDSVTFPQGSDATDLVGAVLLEDSPCNDPSQTLLDMRNDLTLHFVCIGENKDSLMGTWSANEENKSVALNVNTELGPIAITITDVVITNANLTGIIDGLPVPVDYSQPVGLANLQFISAGVIFLVED